MSMEFPTLIASKSTVARTGKLLTLKFALAARKAWTVGEFFF
jgi:hypothetical protein